MVKIKICGLKRREDVDYVNEAMPDFAGFVFAGKKRRIDRNTAAELSSRLDRNIIPVGVFADEPPENIIELAKSGIIRVIQLHGHEDGNYIAALRRETPCEYIIKAVSVRSADDIRDAEKLDADMLLLDNGSGGTGEVFGWEIVKDAMPVSRPIILAGGLNRDNVSEAVMELDPWAVDVSSGVETDGVKDRDKILEFINTVRSI